MNTMDFSFPTFLRDEFDKRLLSLNKKISRISGSRQIEVIGEDYFHGKIADADCHFTKVHLSLPVTPKIEGYSLVGIITNEDESKLIKSFSGENLTHIDHTKCDHCNTKRYRTRTYVLRNGDDTKVIGSSCMKEYLGLDIDGIISRFLKFNETVRELSDFSRINGNHIDQILEAVRILYTKEKTYISANKAYTYADSTKAKVDAIMSGMESFGQADPTIPDVSTIKTMLVDTYGNMDTNTNFNSNVVNTLFYQFDGKRDLRDVILDRARGVFYWAVYNVLSPKKKIEPKPVKVNGDYLGEIGTKIAGKGQVVMAKEVHSQFGSSRLIEIKDESGKSIKTFSNAQSAWNLNLNDMVAFQGTVKKQETFRGVKSTIITRAKFE